MKISILLGVGFFLQCVNGVALAPRQVKTPGVISAPVWRRANIRSVSDDHIRRAHLSRRATGSVSLPLYNADSKLLYFANITIGTPGQKLSLQIDTGSSDIWTETSNSQLCQGRGDPCATTGTYDNSTSSTYKYVNSDFEIQYADGTQAAGDYAKETFQIGNAKVTGQEFGVGVEATSTEGVMGVGFPSNEAIVATAGQGTYPNLVDTMVSQGLIASRTYSLYLDDIDDSVGNILFGGVDTDKFSGTLSTFPINTDSTGVASQFVITLSGLSVTAPGSSTSGVGSSSLYPLSVLLDSGSSYMSLPSEMVTSIASAMGASYSNTLGGFILPNCDQQYSSGTLDFFFSGFELKVPYSEFIVNPTATDGTFFKYNSGENVCMIGAIPGSSQQIAVLGDTFLRSAYVVYDLDNQEISLGQTVFNATSSNIQAIPSGKNAVPSATAVSNPTTLTLGSNLSPSDIPNGQTPTGTGGSIGGATGTGGSGSSSGASAMGLFGTGTTLVMTLSTCIGVLLGVCLAL